MNPNSAHQQWSEWVFTVEQPGAGASDFNATTLALGRFFTATMGSVGQMKVDEAVNVARHLKTWTVTVQAEGESVYQPGWRDYVRRAFEASAARHFGKARVTMDVRLLAGQTATGKPPDQWLIMPTIELPGELWGAASQHKPPPQTMGLPTVPSAARVW